MLKRTLTRTLTKLKTNEGRRRSVGEGRVTMYSTRMYDFDWPMPRMDSNTRWNMRTGQGRIRLIVPVPPCYVYLFVRYRQYKMLQEMLLKDEAICRECSQ